MPGTIGEISAVLSTLLLDTDRDVKYYAALALKDISA
jgi:hypothetical protein